METGDLIVILGKSARRYRLRSGLSQEDLAEYAGVHWTYVRNVWIAEIGNWRCERFRSFLRYGP
jgi:transcriptional regulator with XRE-family HTH domain